MSREPGARERLLADLARELQPLGWRARRRALAEAHDHLLSAIEEELAQGASTAEAEQRVLERFGEPALIAESLLSARPRRGAHARLARRIALAVVFAAAGVTAVLLGAGGASTRPAAPIRRDCLIVLVLTLAGLPLLAGHRRIFGPVGGGRAGWLVRIGAYGTLCALPLAVADVTSFAGARFDRQTFTSAADRAQWHAERVNDAISGSVVLFVIVALYAAGILWLTSRGSSATAAALAAGGGCGAAVGLLAYTLAPFGGLLDAGPLATPLLGLGLACAAVGAPMLAGSLAGDSSQGLRAGLCTGLVAALLVSVLTLPTMAHFPGRVALKESHPNPNLPGSHTYEVQMSVGDGAAKYLFVLLLWPMLGAGLGAAGAEAWSTREAGRLTAASDPAG